MLPEKKYSIDSASLKKGKVLERTLTVTLAYNQVNQLIEKKMNSLGKKAKIKGFRPGKVPRSVLNQHYADQVKYESEEEVVRETISLGFKKEDVSPAGTPSIVSIDRKNDSLTYVVSFEVFPEIKLKEFRKLKISNVTSAINESNVDEMIKRLREQKATWKAVERAANADDRVKVDFEGRINGELFEGGKADNATMELGQGQLIEDFEKGLKGLKKGESTSIKVTFPKDYPNEELQRKKAVFQVACHEVEEKTLPELDDNFLVSIGFNDKTLGDLRAEIKSNLNNELETNLRQVRKKRVFDVLRENNKFDVPVVFVNEEKDYLERQEKTRRGMKEDDALPEEVDFQAIAKDRVALSLILQAIIKERAVKLDENKVDQHLDKLVAAYPNATKMKQSYKAHRESMQQLESQIMEEQITDLVLSEASVSVKEISFDELVKL
jgi:trigger factor